ncbi:asparagine-tRNA ligase [Paracoccidioides brasiliensis]|uniref:Asparagine-tRNA ligase n=1 Tax=Paracoccidioides brasiliensis TaxID=121759 RepID=A0A1D2J381_PARBR|nr:asparagine-tRNA ligase [Paracoccidioides brasiliensis]ODH46101.1 asparagine-tRNA ligase [Paracoccidioides brasiliensis]
MLVWRRFLSTPTSATVGQKSPLLLRCAQLLTGSPPAPAPTSSNAAAGNGSLSSLDNRQIRIQGFVRSVRKQKQFAFAEISDGSTIKSVQAILTPGQAAELSTGTAVDISGIWQPCPAGKKQSHELQVTEVKITGEADPEASTYPIQKKYHSPDFLRQIPHLRIRTPFNSLLSRFRSECIFQLGQVFRSQPGSNFVQVQPPLITSSDCEGAGEVFTVAPGEKGAGAPAEEFFRSPKYLTVSSQLHLEAYAAELGNVWTLSPTFRAEKSDTPRHLSEFYMLEVEMNFVQNLGSLTDTVETLIRDLTDRLYATPVAEEIFTVKRTEDSGHGDGDQTLRKRWLDIMGGGKWPRITYTKVIELLQNAVNSKTSSFKFSPSWDGGLQLEHEKFIVDEVGKGSPVFVTDYPRKLKPFYMAPSAAVERSSSSPTKTDPTPSSTGETVACFDLLMPEICEVVGGSIREHRLPNLIQNMRKQGLIKQAPCADASEPSSTPYLSTTESGNRYPFLEPNEHLGSLQWYADLRRWGSAPHGGFGLGFDRFLGYLTGVSSLRDVVPFPRHLGRAEC